MRNRIVVYICILCCLNGCFSEPKHNKSSAKSVGSKESQEATGFTIQTFRNYKKLTVFDPWQKSSNNQFYYYLLERGKEIPAEIKGNTIIFTPLRRVVCLSTTHIGFLEALGEINTVSGLSGTAYVSNTDVIKGVAENRIREVGNEKGLNYEMIVQLKPDVVFAYGVGAEINAQMNKLRDLGIQTVLAGEYLEQSPLGKAEWIKFFGAFFGKEALADSVYGKLKANYNSVKSSVADVTNRPSVLTGLPFKDTWWIAGGQSNLAVLINDAGGNFLWKENSSREAFPVSLEEVFVRAAKADFWINCGSANSLNELLTFDARFSELPVVKGLRIYNNNKLSTPAGGNDYWESGVVHPDLILKDLVKIFHPEKVANEEFYYYKKLK